MTDQSKKQDKIYTYIGALIAAGLLIWLGINMFGEKKTNDIADESTTASRETTSENLIDGTNLSHSIVEESCEDAEYGVTNGYDVVAVSNYDFQTYDTGSYDKDGNPIIQATWNGRRDMDKQIVKYWCYISGSDDNNITVHYISVGDSNGREDVWKSQEDLSFSQYDKNGNPEYPELH